ncbi:MAG TPA: insulinase family protein [Caldilineaceae bacterium]|nr:insulinase family protein [Caldilineaceae bacterium]
MKPLSSLLLALALSLAACTPIQPQAATDPALMYSGDAARPNPLEGPSEPVGDDAQPRTLLADEPADDEAPSPSPIQNRFTTPRRGATAVLVADPPSPVEVVDRRELPELEVTVVELANGVEVWMKPTDFNEEQVAFAAISPGGISLVDDEDVAEARLISTVVSRSGAGAVSQEELDALLEERQVTLTPVLRELSDGMAGEAAPESLETLLQLVYLYFTAPHADPAVFDAVKAEELAWIEERAGYPGDVMDDLVDDIFFSYNYRLTVLPPAAVEQLDLERAMAVYQDRFGDAGDFAFVFVGAFDVEELIELAQVYLGNLPAAGREEQWQERVPGPPDGITIRKVYRGDSTEDAVAALGFAGPVDYNKQAELELSVLGAVLDEMVRWALRVNPNIYVSEAFTSMTERSEPWYQFWLYIQTQPARMDEVTAQIFDLIDQLQSQGPTERFLAAAKAKRLAHWEEQMADNIFWRENLRLYALFGGEDKLEILQNYPAIIEGVTAREVQQMAQEYLRPDRYINVVVNPEAAAPR